MNQEDKDTYDRTAGRPQEREPLKPFEPTPPFLTLLFIFAVIVIGGLIAAGAAYLVQWVFTALGIK